MQALRDHFYRYGTLPLSAANRIIDDYKESLFDEKLKDLLGDAVAANNTLVTSFLINHGIYNNRPAKWYGWDGDHPGIYPKSVSDAAREIAARNK